MTPVGVIAAWNGVAEATFGWTRSEAVGHLMADLIVPAQHRAAHTHGLNQYLRTGVTRVLNRRIEITALDKGGREFPVELSITTTATAEGTVFVGFLRDISEKQRQNERLRLLVDELNHRVKNTLAIVQSVAMQTFKGPGTDPASRAAFENRLVALASAHDVLTDQHWESASMLAIVGQTGLGCGADHARVLMEGPDLQIPPSTAVFLTLALHELCTNAIKYGALSNDIGRVHITWRVLSTPEHMLLSVEWQERGGPIVAAPTTRGFGTRMIERGLAAELGGTVDLLFPAGGVQCNLMVPIRIVIGEEICA